VQAALNVFPLGFMTAGYGELYLQFPLSFVQEGSVDCQTIFPYEMIESISQLNIGPRLESAGVIQPEICPAKQMMMPAGIQSPATLKELDLLISSLANEVVRTTGEGEDYMASYKERSANIKFKRGTSVFKFCFGLEDMYSECTVHECFMLYQKNCEPPKKLFAIGAGESSSCANMPEVEMRLLLEDMGLVHTSPAELVAFLLCLADPWTDTDADDQETNCNLVYHEQCPQDVCILAESESDVATVCLDCGSRKDRFGSNITNNHTQVIHTYTETTSNPDESSKQGALFASFAPIVTAAVSIIRGKTHTYNAGDSVLVKDDDERTWTPGTVERVEGRAVFVLAEGYNRAFEWDALKRRSQVAVIGMSEGCDGRYEKMQHTAGGRVVYERTAADGTSAVWYNTDHGEWCIGPKGNDGGFGCVAFAANSAAASSPLASELTWYEPAWEPCSSIRVTKSKKKRTKVIEVKGVPTNDLKPDLMLLNGKYRQQALVVDGKPTFKGGQESNHAIWYSERAGEWRIGELGFVGTAAHLVHAEDTAATPNTVKTPWLFIRKTNRSNPFVNIILPSVESAEQEVPRHMQLKMPEVLAAEETRCLGCGHQYMSLAEVVFHEECMHHHCVYCQEGLGDAECAVCMEE
jgi:hypothetical protein